MCCCRAGIIRSVFEPAYLDKFQEPDPYCLLLIAFLPLGIHHTACTASSLSLLVRRALRAPGRVPTCLGRDLGRKLISRQRSQDPVADKFRLTTRPRLQWHRGDHAFSRSRSAQRLQIVLFTTFESTASLLQGGWDGRDTAIAAQKRTPSVLEQSGRPACVARGCG